MLVLRGGTVVDVDGVREADVAMEAGEITAVGDVPEGATTELDVTGQYVAPGLVDSHVHLGFDGRADPKTYQGESVPAKAYRVAGNLRTLVENGVTSVRDLGATADLAIDARNAVDAGTLLGPQVRAAGQNVIMTGGHGHWFGREADGRAEVTKAVREQLKAGADVIKCMATGGVLTEGAETGAPELTPTELDALVAAASAKSVPTAAHAHGVDGIKNAVRAGITSIEHGTYMDREAAELMAERGTYWVPTAKALHGIVDAGTEAGIPEYAVQKAEHASAAFGEAFEHALDAGVPIAMGTDAGTPFNYVADVAEELELMVDHGLTPEHALEAATVNAADLLGLESVGKVQAGYRADVVVLAGNPLEDSTAYQDPVDVVVGGEPVPASRQ